MSTRPSGQSACQVTTFRRSFDPADDGGSLNAIVAGEEFRIGPLEACAQRGPRPPSHAGELGTVEELARHAVGPRWVEDELAAIAHDVGDELGEFSDRHFLAAADIDVLF